MIKKVIVILSTYNGGRYIAEQLDSLLHQSFPIDKILIRDDVSSDNTFDILKKYASMYSNIYLLNDSKGHLGIQSSYLELFTTALHYNPNYVLSCDQDDVWFLNKIEKLLQTIESEREQDKPLLVFTDTQVVDERLQLIAPSYMHFQKLKNATSVTFKKLLLICPALGCTMIFNRKVLEQTINMPKTLINPDKWLLYIAVCHGKVIYLPESTLLYRQHHKNVAGAMQGIKRKLFNPENFSLIKKRYQKALEEALIIKRSLPNLNCKDKKTLEKFILLFTGTKLNRIRLFPLFFFSMPHWKRKLALFASLFFRFNE